MKWLLAFVAAVLLLGLILGGISGRAASAGAIRVTKVYQGILGVRVDAHSSITSEVSPEGRTFLVEQQKTLGEVVSFSVKSVVAQLGGTSIHVTVRVTRKRGVCDESWMLGGRRLWPVTRARWRRS